MRIFILTLAMALLAALAPLGASATELVPATERLLISAGCPQDTPGTCTSTRWLGKTPGDANSNFLTSTTPVDEVLYRATGEPNWRDYPSDGSIKAGGYLMDPSRDILLTLTVMNNAVMVNETVHARVTVSYDGFKSMTLTAPAQEMLLIQPGASQAFEFTMDVPDSLAGVTVTGITAEVAVNGINAQGGYINQSGASFVRIPHLVPAA